MTRHLLVPMDDSEPARTALEHALSLFPDDEITVVHAVDDLAAGYTGTPTAQEGEAVNPELFADVERLADEYGADVEIAVIGGAPPEAILEYADDHAVDQIVMGSEGRTGVSRMLLGSIAEGVARRASVPVTIVR